MHVTVLRLLPNCKTQCLHDDESESRERASITQDHFTLWMGPFSASQVRMEEKFAEFYAEIRLGQEDAAANALERSRYEKPHEYKHKGNKQQAAFNAKLDEAVAEAKLQIEEAGPSKAPAVERSKEALKKGRLVSLRMGFVIEISPRNRVIDIRLYTTKLRNCTRNRRTLFLQ